MAANHLDKIGENVEIMLGISGPSHSSSASLHANFMSDCRPHEERIKLSPRSSQLSFCAGSNTTALEETSNPKAVPPATELVKEIATLELEVLHLERYLLSLYRETFDHFQATSLIKDQVRKLPSICGTGPSISQGEDKSKLMSLHLPSSLPNSAKSKWNESQSIEDIRRKRGIEFQDLCCKSSHNLADSKDIRVPAAGNNSTDSPTLSSGRRCLAEYLCSSLIDGASESPCKLSEEIIRCMSSIYIKLSDQAPPQIDSFASPTSSLSSSSAFSLRDTNDPWNLMFRDGAAIDSRRSEVLKNKQGPYTEQLEVLKLCVDGDKFNYAEAMLQRFKSLIHRLEKVNPTKMEHEGKLAFWINVHNALVMHAAYNVGGSSVNAYVIQRSILGCQPHRPGPRLQSLFMRSEKFHKLHEKHPYALSKREPLVHFALCVRVFSSKNILKELELARDEFLRAKVSIHKETKILLPQILRHYAKGASLDLPSLMEIVHNSMPEPQKKAIKRCVRGNPEKRIQWLPHRASFRYMVHQDLLKD
ncbi:unnamed protein product [Spirodela intermedia]|uniref:Uncharacterized protein n=1 Tax=Spirodela intermedia TaxID=51605 RepID=A0A7I8IUU3_SPIIN|nr:unnamed protein product [Spirodela intermedia]CAA6661637.1 unnamed protein product [Spirodela intermedia]